MSEYDDGDKIVWEGKTTKWKCDTCDTIHDDRYYAEVCCGGEATVPPPPGHPEDLDP